MSKFKVGDRVKGKFSGETGTIVHIDPSLHEGIIFKEDNGGGLYAAMDSRLVRLRKKEKKPHQEFYIVEVAPFLFATFCTERVAKKYADERGGLRIIYAREARK